MPDRDVKTIPPTKAFEGKQDLIYYQYAMLRERLESRAVES
jgi:hypothetical protein